MGGLVPSWSACVPRPARDRRHGGPVATCAASRAGLQQANAIRIHGAERRTTTTHFVAVFSPQPVLARAVAEAGPTFRTTQARAVARCCSWWQRSALLLLLLLLLLWQAQSSHQGGMARQGHHPWYAHAPSAPGAACCKRAACVPEGSLEIARDHNLD